MTTLPPEKHARVQIDAMLGAAGWAVQDYRDFNPGAALGVALREAPLKSGTCDYLLLINRQAAGVIEAKKEGTLLSGVAEQSGHYAVNLPDFIQAVGADLLPFRYESTGVETLFRDERDPHARSRRVFSFHRPETLAAWANETETLRARLARMPFAHPLPDHGLRSCQIEGIHNLEQSFVQSRPRALIQMATGAGKTYTACSFTYRLIKHANARRVLFLVDRANLGRQAMTEFQQFVVPDTGRKFTEVYNIQHLLSNRLDDVCRVTICTVQRLYSILRGEELAEDADEYSGYEVAAADDRPKDVVYNPAIPIEYFDFIVTDECHRSIYGLWRQVLEYFDAFLIGLTATPSKQTIGFFQQNLVMEYNHERAVADGVNVGYDVYRIRTQVTEQGGKVEKGYYIDKRSKETRAVRWERLDEDLVYAQQQLDRSVVVPSQIRTILETFRDVLFIDLFPGRSMVPKTLIFCKDDSHAEDTVHIIREVFGRGNDFAKKITYKTYNPETRRYEKSETLIQEFRTSPQLRIAVTVDMIATGTDIKPLECLLFLRDTRSRTYFEQMKGRGTRVLTPTDLQAVSGADALAKTHFVIVDAVGVCESDKTDSRPLERKPTVAFKDLLLGVALGKRDEDTLTTLANRLARLDRQISGAEAATIKEVSGGKSLPQLSAALLHACNPDEVEVASRRLAAEEEDAYIAEIARFFDPLAPVEITAANLPHWKQDGATYFVTFRLADSLPQDKLEQWHEEREIWLRRQGISSETLPRSTSSGKMPLPRLSKEQQSEYHRLFSARIEHWLDQDYGSCVLVIPECQKIVENALKFFDGQRYRLGVHVVAANHVHAIVTPYPGEDLSKILHSWKSFTAKEIIKVEAASCRLKPFWDEVHHRRVEAASVEAASRRLDYPQINYQRPVWQKESYDHIVRSEEALRRIEAYIRSHAAWKGERDEDAAMLHDKRQDAASTLDDKRQDAASTLRERAQAKLIQEACAPFDLPPLRDALTRAKQESEQVIDTVTVDTVIEQDYSMAAKEKAQGLLRSFRDYIEEHQAEITALDILYRRPYKQRLTESMLKELEEKLRATDAHWTEDTLWRAFAATAPEKVKGRSAVNRFADLVPLVRFALEQQPVLEPFAQSVHERFDAWLQGRCGILPPGLDRGSGVPPLGKTKRQDAASTAGEDKRRDAASTGPEDKRQDASSTFTPDQLAWLELIRDHIATSLSIEADDFDYAPFAQKGGLGKAYQLFGDDLDALLEELNEVLAA